jgi:CRISPR/Cas system CMR subunit Cmr6 (Cas7 group RAMP superfamily)
MIKVERIVETNSIYLKQKEINIKILKKTGSVFVVLDGRGTVFNFEAIIEFDPARLVPYIPSVSVDGPITKNEEDFCVLTSAIKEYLGGTQARLMASIARHHFPGETQNLASTQ